MKYFEQGDAIRILEGKYQKETGIIMSVTDDQPHLPMVKLDSTHLEIQMNTNNLKLKELREENAKSVAMRTIDPNKRNGSIALMQ